MDFGGKMNAIDQEMVRNMKGKFSRGFKGAKILVLILVAFIIVLTMNPFVIIGAGERGVILNFGEFNQLFTTRGFT